MNDYISDWVMSQISSYQNKKNNKRGTQTTMHDSDKKH